MIFTPTPITGAYQIDLAPAQDERGFFARSFCAEVFSSHGLASVFPQCNISFNDRRGTLRGLHGTLPTHSEAKLVRCTAGAVWDVIVDARPESSAFGRWHALELSAENRRMAYIPAGCLHGFLTRTADTEMFYQMSAAYHPEAALGVRWDDPDLAIVWPAPPRLVGRKDWELPSWKILAGSL